MWSKFSESGALAAEQKIIGVHISFAEFSLDYDYDYIKAFLNIHIGKILKASQYQGHFFVLIVLDSNFFLKFSPEILLLLPGILVDNVSSTLQCFIQKASED